MVDQLPGGYETDDPDDAWLLALADAASADFLITGDRRSGLLARRHVGRTRIVSAAAFCKSRPVAHADTGGLLEEPGTTTIIVMFPSRSWCPTILLLPFLQLGADPWEGAMMTVPRHGFISYAHDDYQEFHGSSDPICARRNADLAWISGPIPVSMRVIIGTRKSSTYRCGGYFRSVGQRQVY